LTTHGTVDTAELIKTRDTAMTIAAIINLISLILVLAGIIIISGEQPGLVMA
jgi:hypothetical protein